MGGENSKSWHLNRQVSLSVIVQLILLASLIIGSWVNLQRQLDLLRHDVTMLLQYQKQFQEKIETLQAQSLSHEYRLQAVEKEISKNGHQGEPF